MKRRIRARVCGPPNVPDTADALDVLEVIKGAPVHMALVHDEYGHFQGVVTNPTFWKQSWTVPKRTKANPMPCSVRMVRG